MAGIVNNEEIARAWLLQLLAERRVDPLLGGLFILEINDLRIRHAILFEELDKGIVAPVLHRERAVGFGVLPTQHANDEDPRFLRLPPKVFGETQLRNQLQDEPDG